MSVNQRRYDRLHHLFSTLRRDQLEALGEVLDASQWLELVSLYREMAAEAEREDVEDRRSPGTKLEKT